MADANFMQIDKLPDSQVLIAQVCDEIKEMLLEKNRKYGDSALNPTRIFAKSDSVEQIKVRIDDKLNRLKNAQGDEDEDVVLDLMGYLVLLRVAHMRDEKCTAVDDSPSPGFPDEWSKISWFTPSRIPSTYQPYYPKIYQLPNTWVAPLAGDDTTISYDTDDQQTHTVHQTR